MADFKEEIERVKAGGSLRDLCDRHLERRGRDNYVCPVCDSGNKANRTAAMHVNGETWHCFACGAGGDALDLMGAIIHTDDKRAQLEAVADAYGVAIEETAGRRGIVSRSKAISSTSTTNLPSEHGNEAQNGYSAGRKAEAAYIKKAAERMEAREAVEYMERRGFTFEECRAMGVGYDPERRRIVLPWRGCDWYHIDRSIDHDGDGKYLKPKTAAVGAQPLYNREAVTRGTRPYFVVEGVMDALAIEAVGGVAVALGGTAIDVYVAAARSSITKPVAILMLDNDDAGNQATYKLEAALDAAGVAYCNASLFQFKDAAEILAKKRDLLRESVDYSEKAALEKAERLRAEAWNKMLKSLNVRDPVDVAGVIFDGTAMVGRIPTGLEELDEALGGGLPEVGLIVMGALSSMGKTTLASQLADTVAKAGRSVLFVTIEQSAEEITAKSISRYMARYSRADGTAVWASSQAVLSPEERARWEGGDGEKIGTLYRACEEYTADVDGRLLIMEGVEQPGVSDVRTVAQRMAERDGAAPVIFIDYLQLLAPHDPRESDKQAVDNNIRALRHMARDLHTCVFALSSLNRASYGEGVTLESFKESGGVEYGADVLLGLQPRGMADRLAGVDEKKAKKEAREAVRDHKDKDNREVELVILKNRNGRVPRDGVALDYNAITNTFTAAGASWRSVSTRRL